MDAWEEGKFAMLVQGTQCTMEANLPSSGKGK
jgi:hypothetical protein